MRSAGWRREGPTMSRASYDEDIDNWQLIKWRGAVKRAIRGKRGQAFLKELAAALDALPVQRLISGELEAGWDVCAIGAVGITRGVDMSSLDPYDYDTIASTFGIAAALAREIEFENDDVGRHDETPEQRFARVRLWVAANIAPESPP